MRNLKLAALVLLGIGFTAITTDALAEDVAPEASMEGPAIKDGAIKEFNPTWDKARKLDESLVAMDNQLKAARGELATALAIGTDAPLEKALEDMKATAGDKLVVTIETGNPPKLSATEDAPDNVKAFAVAADKSAAAAHKLVGDATALKPAVEELVKEAAAIPAQITPAILKDNGLKKPGDIKAEKDLIAANVEAIKLIPGHADGVISAATEFLTLIQGLK